MSRSNTGSDKPFVFTGTDELRSADVMHNYNRGITSVFKRGWVRASRGDRVLDFGAGMGSITEEFFVQTGVRPIALEIDKTLADLVRARGYAVIDTLADVSPGTLDLVFSSNVLEHIKDDVALVRQVFSALRPGGIFALYVPAFPFLYTAYDRKIGHERRYTRQGLAAKLVAGGFLLLEDSYGDCLGFVAALAYKVLRGDSQQSPTPGQLRAYDKMYPLSSLLDHLGMKHLFGKNLAVIARRPDVQAS
jgi:SAM-dependent methyltransferase